MILYKKLLLWLTGVGPHTIKIVILCGTNNIFNDSPYDIVDGIIKIASTFEKFYPNSSIYISGLLPRDESWSVNRVTIDEINKSLQYQCIREGFIYIDQSINWTYKNRELDPVLFYKDSLHLVEKGNVKLAESFCSTRTSSTNVRVFTKQFFLCGQCLL